MSSSRSFRPRSRPRPRALLPAILAGLALGGAAPAQSEVLLGPEPAFDNTIVSTYADGRSAKLWLDRDGRYRGEGRRGDASSGKWSVKRGRLCFKQARPVPVPAAFCTPMVEGGVGTVWAAKSVFGEPLTVELAAGR